MTGNPEATLFVHAGNSAERTQSTARKLAADLRHRGIQAEESYHTNAQGTRGEVLAIGQLALVFLTGGAATALIECIRAYLLRDDTLSIDVSTKDGKKITINSKNVSSDDTEKVLRSIEKLNSN